MFGNFLVAPQMGAYLHHFDNGATICVAVPSMAEHYCYRIADRLAYLLRSHGFEEAHVCGLDGMPATPESIVNDRSEFTVFFNRGNYFAGLDDAGKPRGTKDLTKIVSLSKSAAMKMHERLRNTWPDAQVIEYVTDDNVEEELKALRGIAPNPEALQFKS